MELAEQIKSLRCQRGFTQSKIGLLFTDNPISANRIGARIEKGQRKLDVSELKKIAELFNIRIDELLAYVPNGSPLTKRTTTRTYKAQQLGISPQALFCREHPEQSRARGRSHYNRNNGKKILFECNCDVEKKEEHHPDYLKPMEVVLCCHKCHMAHHARSRAKN